DLEGRGEGVGGPGGGLCSGGVGVHVGDGLSAGLSHGGDGEGGDVGDAVGLGGVGDVVGQVDAEGDPRPLEGGADADAVGELVAELAGEDGLGAAVEVDLDVLAAARTEEADIDAVGHGGRGGEGGGADGD